MNPRLIALDARLVGGSSTGDSTYWTGLLQGLQTVDSEFRFLLLSNAPKPPEIPLSSNFLWQQVPSRSSRLWSLLRFPLAVRRAGAKAVHTQYNLSPLIRGNGITTIHDVSFFIGPEWFRPRDRLLLRRMVPASAWRAARVITVSETSKSEIERFIPGIAGKIRVTYPAAHPQLTPIPHGEASEAVASKFGQQGPFCLTVGTRWPRKNMQLAVDAAVSAGVDLLVTGKPGWGEENFGGHVKATGYVTFTDLSALYSAAGLYLAPSRHEGFGITLIEAFECGCPVLCSSGGAMPEVSGGAAEVLTSWEAGDWSARIRSLLADSSKLASLRERGLQRAKDFTWEKTARKTLEVYREVVDK